MINTKNLILIGGGGHCKAVIDVAEGAGYLILGILDIAENIGKKVLGYPIIGTDEMIPEFAMKALFLVTVGQIKNAQLRIDIHRKISNCGGHLATLIASSAYVSKYSEIGEGTVIMNQAVINADSRIGKGCIINTFADIEHDTIVDDYCHISTGAIVNGNCFVGKGSFLGSQAVMVNGISIVDFSFIAAGSVVIKSITQKGLFAGNPAHFKKSLLN